MLTEGEIGKIRILGIRLKTKINSFSGYIDIRFFVNKFQ